MIEAARLQDEELNRTFIVGLIAGGGGRVGRVALTRLANRSDQSASTAYCLRHEGGRVTS